VCWNEVLLISPMQLPHADIATLAKAELYLTLATVFRQHDHQEPFVTTRTDVDLKHDMFMPQLDM